MWRGWGNLRLTDLVWVAQPAGCRVEIGGVGRRFETAERGVPPSQVVVHDSVRNAIAGMIELEDNAFVRKLVPSLKRLRMPAGKRVDNDLPESSGETITGRSTRYRRERITKYSGEHMTRQAEFAAAEKGADSLANAALALLRREAILGEGHVPSEIDGALTVTPTYAISRQALLLTLPNGLRFHYRRGRGCAFARDGGVSDEEVELFFNGSVYGAIAWINGLVPLHASSVIHDGRVYAFTGVSGAGKSTLVSALANLGFAIFSDDVLVLVPGDGARAHGLPGHKRLKLWGNSLKLTGRDATASTTITLTMSFLPLPRPPRSRLSTH